MASAETSGLTLIDLVDALTENGYINLKDLEKIPPNPLLWNRQQWNFALSVIAKGLGIPKAEVKKHYKKAGEILQIFNATLRKTGLIIEMQQITQISESDLLKQLKGEPQKEIEWRNE